MLEGERARGLNLFVLHPSAAAPDRAILISKQGRAPPFSPNGAEENPEPDPPSGCERGPLIPAKQLPFFFFLGKTLMAYELISQGVNRVRVLGPTALTPDAGQQLVEKIISTVKTSLGTDVFTGTRKTNPTVVIEVEVITLDQ